MTDPPGSESGLARFYRAAGYRVLSCERAEWFDASPRVFQSLPGARMLDPSREELRAFVKRHSLAGVQFATRAGYGLPTRAYSVADKAYGLASTRRTFRQNVLKGAGECEVRKVGFDQLARAGLALNRATLARHGRGDPRFLDLDSWRRYCAAGAASPDVGAMGAFHLGGLAAYLVYVVDQAVCHGLHMFSSRAPGSPHATHVLYYEFTKRMIGRADVHTVSVGLDPIPPSGQIGRFKRHAGYRAEPCRLAVVLHPMLEPLLVSRPAAALLALGRHPRIARVRAVAAMARASLADPATAGRG